LRQGAIQRPPFWRQWVSLPPDKRREDND